PAGTALIFEYFGRVLPPSFGIRDGIEAGRLVPYDYHIELVELSDAEWVRWRELSEEIGLLMARTQDDPEKRESIEERLEMLLIARARLKKKASRKPEVAASLIRENYRPGDRWLVYCDDREQMSQ